MLKTSSGKIVILLSFIFCLGSIDKLTDLNEDENRCLVFADGFGYYMYLPHLFEKGSLNISHEWAQEKQCTYCNCFPAYQLKQQENGNSIDIYHMGQSYLYLPSYLVVDGYARIFGFKADGFTTPYHVAFIINALLFILLGIYYTRKLLLLFVSDRVAMISMIVIYLATNSLMTLNIQQDLPHIYLYTLNTIILYHTFKYHFTTNKRNLIYAALFLGLASAMRPTEVLIGLIPLFVVLKKHRLSFQSIKLLLLFPLMGLLWNIPQILYWKMVGGHFFFLNLHSEDIVLSDPHIYKFLFSYQKGWLLYTPIFILLPLAFWKTFTKNRLVFWSTLSLFLIYTYVICSWETWFYAASYSARPMVDIYPVLVVVIAVFISTLRKTWSKILVGTFGILCLTLNLIQSKQVELGYLHPERMTEEHYWYIFGKLDMPNYEKSRLMMNRGDINWMNNQRLSLSPCRSIESSIIYESPELRTYNTQQISTITELVLYDHIKTDETQFELHLKVKVSNGTLPVIVKMDCFSEYNSYSWNAFDIAKKNDGDYFSDISLSFNCPIIRHDGDKMLIYISIPEGQVIEIKDLKLEAHSLIRK